MKIMLALSGSEQPNVNLTSRLEGLTKYYGVSLLISQETLENISNLEDYHIRFLDHVIVKGKELPIKIYEIFDTDPEDLFQKKLQTLLDFEEGQRLYYARQFEAAKRCFQQVLAIIPNDLTTQLYLERCDDLLQNGVPKDWTGGRRMDKK